MRMDSLPQTGHLLVGFSECFYVDIKGIGFGSGVWFVVQSKYALWIFMVCLCGRAIDAPALHNIAADNTKRTQFYSGWIAWCNPRSRRILSRSEIPWRANQQRDHPGMQYDVITGRHLVHIIFFLNHPVRI